MAGTLFDVTSSLESLDGKFKFFELTTLLLEEAEADSFRIYLDDLGLYSFLFNIPVEIAMPGTVSLTVPSGGTLTPASYGYPSGLVTGASIPAGIIQFAVDTRSATDNAAVIPTTETNQGFLDIDFTAAVSMPADGKIYITVNRVS
jgi:hypothetical protein